ncbi:hypothetical protein N0V90_012966 [Kalmusia sp. IMI 367209]|nr:hypothetical protein N0V90_012966 [Kalmusia sp. IMI 367209]
MSISSFYARWSVDIKRNIQHHITHRALGVAFGIILPPLAERAPLLQPHYHIAPNFSINISQSLYRERLLGTYPKRAMISVWALALRSAHLAFSLIVVGLSANLVATQWDPNTVPFSHSWATFVGAGSFLAGIFGLASNWIGSLDERAMIILDEVLVLINLSAGIVSKNMAAVQSPIVADTCTQLIALAITGIKCSGQDDANNINMVKNALLNYGSDDESIWYSDMAPLRARCVQNQADVVFLFLNVAVLTGITTLDCNEG